MKRERPKTAATRETAATRRHLPNELIYDEHYRLARSRRPVLRCLRLVSGNDGRPFGPRLSFRTGDLRKTF